MKVAWLFAGLPRSPELMSEHFLHLMKLYDSTVVAHFWTCNENGKKAYIKWEPGHTSEKSHYVSASDTHPAAIEDFKRIYSPTQIVTESCSTSLLLDEARKRKEFYRPYYGQLSAQRALSLVDPGKFDVIVKCRTDVIINLEEFSALEIKDNSCLHVLGTFIDQRVPRVNDTFFYGRPNVMTSLLNTVDSYWSLAEEQATNVHKALDFHCKRLGIPVIHVGGPSSGRKIGK